MTPATLPGDNKHGTSPACVPKAASRLSRRGPVERSDRSGPRANLEPGVQRIAPGTPSCSVGSPCGRAPPVRLPPRTSPGDDLLHGLRAAIPTDLPRARRAPVRNFAGETLGQVAGLVERLVALITLARERPDWRGRPYGKRAPRGQASHRVRLPSRNREAFLPSRRACLRALLGHPRLGAMRPPRARACRNLFWRRLFAS